MQTRHHTEHNRRKKDCIRFWENRNEKCKMKNARLAQLFEWQFLRFSSCIGETINSTSFNHSTMNDTEKTKKRVPEFFDHSCDSGKKRAHMNQKLLRNFFQKVGKLTWHAFYYGKQ